jgi:hypothetical protein
MDRRCVNTIVQDFLGSPDKDEKNKDSTLKCYDDLLEYLAYRVQPNTFFSKCFEKGPVKKEEDKKSKLITHMNKCPEERYCIILTAFLKGLEPVNIDKDHVKMPDFKTERIYSDFFRDFELKFHPDVEREASEYKPDYRSMYTMGINWPNRVLPGFYRVKILKDQFSEFLKIMNNKGVRESNFLKEQSEEGIAFNEMMRKRGMLQLQQHCFPEISQIKVCIEDFSQLVSQHKASAENLHSMARMFKMANAALENNLICYDLDDYRERNQVTLTENGGLSETPPAILTQQSNPRHGKAKQKSH